MVDVVADQARQQIAVIVLRVFLLHFLQAGPETIRLVGRREILLLPESPAKLRRPRQGHGKVGPTVPGILPDPFVPSGQCFIDKAQHGLLARLPFLRIEAYLGNRNRWFTARKAYPVGSSGSSSTAF